MTELAFHFGAPDKVAYACRLLRKAVGSGARVMVVAQAHTVQHLDAALWGVGATDFVAHCTASAPPAMQARASVVIAEAPVSGDFPILVNLHEAIPDGFENFDRVIEVVSTDDYDRSQARERWKAYTAKGYAIQRHDLALRGG